MSLCFSNFETATVMFLNHNLGSGVGPISLITALGRQLASRFLSSRRARAT